jgi:mono/diheme cytochrome c family protein
MKYKLGWFIVAVGLLASSCEDKKEGKCTETKISQHGESESHNAGANCMNCHANGGEGEGCFNVAGTVYDTLLSSTLSNVVIKLYTEPNGAGTLKYTINADANGNFYTTENMAASGLYPAIVGPTQTQYMGSSASTGSCNSCHGNTTNKLWAK